MEYYKHNGKSDSIKGWARALGLPYHTLRARLKLLGWSFEKAISEPIQDQKAKDKGNKRCSACETKKPLSEFSTRRKGVASYCRPCENKRTRKRNIALRREVLSFYSGSNDPKCACCGEARLTVLDLDHINGGGQEDRMKLGSSPFKIYRDLRAKGFPSGFRVLCRNCNWIEYLRRTKRGEFFEDQ